MQLFLWSSQHQLFKMSIIQKAIIYTDGSCHTQHRLGGWAALVFLGDEKKLLTGMEPDTTHNRMELTAVIKAIEYVQQNEPKVEHISIVSDSQYVVQLTTRKNKLEAKNFITKKGTAIQNTDLVQQLLQLTVQLPIEFIKIAAHQKQNGTANYNIEVDVASRQVVRQAVAQLT